MTFKNFSIIIAGSLGAGKTTGALYLADKYDNQHLSFVDKIWVPILNERKLEINRRNLQVLGVELMSKMGPQKLVESLLREAVPKKNILIDDVRRGDVVGIIKDFCLGAFLIYIEADFNTRFPRLVARDNIKSEEEQLNAENFETELTIPELKLMADVVIHNNGDKNLFYSHLDQAMSIAERKFSSLKEHIGAKPLINSLRDNRVDYLTSTYASDIDTVAKVLGIDKSYLSVQVRVLLPFYNHSIIHNSSQSAEIYLIRDILTKLRNSLDKFEKTYLKHRLLNGIDRLPENLMVIDKGDNLIVKNNEKSFNIRFGIVDENIGFDIQDNLHYIHKRRSDTKFHFGLFLEEYQYPICYCAVSECDRKYQVYSLSNVIGHDISIEKVYVMTRAFGFTPLPHNMMSKFFDNVVKFIRYSNRVDQNYHDFLITALNPFLGFNGGIFLGSSFTPYATSPMEYRYNKNGLYFNRKTDLEEKTPQAYTTPSILWLARPLTTNARKLIEAIKCYYTISKEEYENG